MASQPVSSRRRATRWIVVVSIVSAAIFGATRWSDVRPAGASSDTISISGPEELGIGLQDVYQIVLSDPAPDGGLAVSVDSNDPTCVIAPSENTAGGSAAVSVTVPTNRRRATFVVQSTDTAAAVCTISATAMDWVGGSLEVDIVQPRLRIRGLGRRISPLAHNDPFFVEAGVPNGSTHGLRYVQGLAKGSTAVDVEVCSDAPATGTIVNRFGQDTPPPGCEENPIVAPFSRTVPGDFAFDPIAGSMTDVTVTASAPGFTSDTRLVRVRDLTVRTEGADEIGESLQDTYVVLLSDAPATDTTITISVPDTASCAVAPTEHSLADLMITRIVQSGRRRASFVVQGVAQTTGGSPCTVTVDAGAYGSDQVEIDIVEPALRIRRLPSTTSQYADNSPFFVELGVPGEHRTLRLVQQRRIGVVGESPVPGPLTVTCNSDTPAVGTIVNVLGQDVDSDGMESTPAPVGFSRTVPGNLAFDPLTGSTTPVLVTCSAPGFRSDDQDVLVRPAALELSGSEELGIQLQDDYRVRLRAAGNHDAVTVTLTSNTPDVCLLGATPHAAPSASIDRPISADDDAADFVVNALDGVIPGTLCELEATATGYAPATLSIAVVEPGIEIRHLARNLGDTASNDAFVVFVGLPNSSNTQLRGEQRLGRGTGDLPIKACSSNPDAGIIVDETNTNNAAAVDDPPGSSCEDDLIHEAFQSNTPADLQLDPQAPGNTSVCATANGFITQSETGCIDVRIGGDSIRLSVKPLLGSGLQETAELRLTRPAGAGGVSVTLTSDNPAYCRLSPDPGTAASSSPLVVLVAEGDDDATFVVAALEGLDEATCTITATATGFLSDEAAITVRQLVREIVELDRTTGTTADDDDFTVQIGAPGPGGHLRFVQAVRIGGVAVPVEACSSDIGVGTIVGAVGNCRTQYIAPGSSQTTFSFHVEGAGSTKVTVTGGSGIDDQVRVRVAQTVVHLSGADEVGVDLQDDYKVRVNHDGGITVTVTAVGDPIGACLIAAAGNQTGDGSEMFVIAAGERDAHFVVQATAAGTCTLTATAMGVPDDVLEIALLPSRLRLVRLPDSIGTQARNHPFFVEIGPANPDVPEVISNRDNRHGILRAQPRRYGLIDLPVDVCSSVAAAALIKDPGTQLTAACANDVIVPLSSRSDDFELDPNSGASPPNNVTDITAMAPGVDPTQHRVVVTAAGMHINGADIIGAGLQDTYRIGLAHSPPPGGVDITVTASPAATCKVSLSGGTPQSSILLHTDDRSAEFVLLGIAADPLYPCVLTATAPGYQAAEEEVWVVTPALQIAALDRRLSVFGNNEPFRVQTGARSPERPNQFIEQAVQAATTVTACVDDNNVAVISGATPVVDPLCQSAVIPAGADETREFSLDAVSQGCVIVDVSATGFDSDSQTVCISDSVVRITVGDQLGAGLQIPATLRLGHQAPSAVNVQVCVDAGSAGRCEVAVDETSNGANCIYLPIAANHSVAHFWVQGIENAMGECAISADAGAGYDLGAASIEVVTPGFDIRQLSRRQFTLDSPDRFIVRIGVPDALLRHVRKEQELRYNTRSGAVLNVPVVVCSSDPAVGTIIGGALDSLDPTHCRQSVIEQLESRSTDFSFDPDDEGETIVYVREVDGYLATDDASVAVKVDNAALRIDGQEDLGIGLQDEYHVSIAQAAPEGGTPVTIRSLTTTICKVSSTRTGANQDLITPSVLKGKHRLDFWVRGLLDGECLLEASAAGHSTTQLSVDVGPDALAIRGLPHNIAFGGGEERFDVEIGVPDDGLHRVRSRQEVSSVGSGRLIEACSSNTAVGTILGGTSHPDMLKAHCRAATIAAGADVTDVFAFDPAGQGETVVTVACIDASGTPSADCVPVDRSSVAIEVSLLSIRIHGPDPIAAGLQDDYSATIGNQAPAGGITVTITSDTPSRCLVAATLLHTGAPSIPVIVPEGKKRAEFVVQGVDNAGGECSITASAPGYDLGDAELEIVPMAVAIHGLDPTQAATGRNEPFNVDVGPARENLRCTRNCQPVAIDGGIPVSVCSSVTGVGVVLGGTPGATGCRTTTLAKGQCRLGIFAFDPLAEGVTYVTAASANADVPVDCGTVDVTVRNAALHVNGADQLGVDLQEEYHVSFSGVPANGTTVTLTPTGACVLSATQEGPPGPTPLIVVVPNNRSRIDFWVQSLATGTCAISIATSASGYNAESLTIDMGTPGVQISGLSSSRSTGSSDEPFAVDIGVAASNLRHVQPRQEVRAHSPAYPLPYVNLLNGVALKVCSSNTAAGTIVGGQPDSDTACRQFTIAQLNDRTDLPAFRVGSGGNTVVCVVEDGVPLVITDNACREVRVAPETISLNGRDKVGSGLMEEYTLVLSEPVDADTTFNVCSSSTTLCKVAVNESSAAADCKPIVVPENKARATFWIHGLEHVSGPCEITASSLLPSVYVPGATEIEIVAHGYRLVNLDSSRSTQSPDDPFNVEIGVPRDNLTTLLYPQVVRYGSLGMSVQVCSTNRNIARINGDNMLTGCKPATVLAGVSRSAENALQLHAQGPGTATIYIDATGTGGIVTDAGSKEVRIATTTVALHGPDAIGSGLQDEFSIQTSTTVASATQFRVQSVTTSVCKVSIARTTVGTPFVDITIPSGRSKTYFFIHAQDGAFDEQCELSITRLSGAVVEPGLGEVDIVKAGLKLVGLSGSLKTSGGDSNFKVQVGLPTASLKTLRRVQERRALGGALPISVCSSEPVVATIVTSGIAAACRTAYINAATSEVEVAIRPLAEGTTIVTASNPDMDPVDTASKEVSVSQGSISLSGFEAIGSGLQETFTVSLNPKAPSTADVPIRLESLTSARCVVAINEATVGGPILDTFVKKGRATLRFAVQAIQPNTGTCTIRVSSTNPTYTGEDLDIEIKQAALRIRSLDGTTTMSAGDDPFFIDIGVARDNLTDLRRPQTVRKGTTLTVSACSSNTAVGTIIGGGADPVCKTATIVAESSSTASNALKFRPGMTTGSTIVDARGTGMITTDQGVVDVVVTTSSLSIEDTNADRIGAGLMDTFKVKTSSNDGATVRVSSLTLGICRVALSESSPAADYVDVVIPVGNKTKTFAIHALTGALGACKLSATAATFADGFATFDVVQPALRIDGLPSSKIHSANNDPFYVDVGIPRSTLANLQVTQKVRTGGSAVTIEVCSSETAFGLIYRYPTTAACRDVQLLPGNSRTPTDSTGFQFDAKLPGLTVVSATAAGHLATDAATIDVDVRGDELSIESPNAHPVGAGLQQAGYFVHREGPTNFAVNLVRVTSTTPLLCQLSTSESTAGVTYVDLSIAYGSANTGYFFVQGIEGALGACQLKAEAIGYGYYVALGSVDIVRPAIRINNLPENIASTAANVAFNVETGVANGTQADLAITQDVRGGSTGLDITITHINPAVGSLVGNGSSTSVTVHINATESINAAGTLAFDPNNALGSTAGTTIAATHPDCISTTAATKTVVVTVGGGPGGPGC